MIYVHVPFCRSFCTYCDFYSELCGTGADSIQAYERGIISEIESRREEILSTRKVNTLYIGGGTPSVLPLSVLEHIVHALPLSDFTEFTVEVNPDDIIRLGEDYVRGLLSLGVNRISMGVQSLDDDMLRWMNRRHNAASAVEAVRILRSAGVRNLSLDVIFGISHLSDNALSATLRDILALQPEHVSAYQLSIEEGSALARMVDDGRYTEATDEQCRAQYDIICAALSRAGYNHYEISNWALPGHEARHNSAYWSRAPYVGLGPAAHSLTLAPSSSRAGGPDAPDLDSTPVTPPVSLTLAGGSAQVRSWNSQEIDGWTREYETLTPEEIREEEIMLGLRTSRGIPWDGQLPPGFVLLPAAPSLGQSVHASSSASPTFDQTVPASSSASPSLGQSAHATILDGIPAKSHIRIPEENWFIADALISSLL